MDGTLYTHNTDQYSCENIGQTLSFGILAIYCLVLGFTFFFLFLKNGVKRWIDGFHELRELKVSILRNEI